MWQNMCILCGYVYDEAQGAPDENIAPGNGPTCLRIESAQTVVR